jgi:hypothetical protein
MRVKGAQEFRDQRRNKEVRALQGGGASAGGLGSVGLVSGDDETQPAYLHENAPLQSFVLLLPLGFYWKRLGTGDRPTLGDVNANEGSRRAQIEQRVAGNSHERV